MVINELDFKNRNISHLLHNKTFENCNQHFIILKTVTASHFTPSQVINAGKLLKWTLPPTHTQNTSSNVGRTSEPEQSMYFSYAYY
jgi:hypothetical protein